MQPGLCKDRVSHPVTLPGMKCGQSELPPQLPRGFRIRIACCEVRAKDLPSMLAEMAKRWIRIARRRSYGLLAEE